MKRWALRIVTVAVLMTVGFYAWRIWFPGPEQIIRRQLADLARIASVAPNEPPLRKLPTAQQLAGFFTRDAEVSVDVPGRSSYSISGRDELREAALSARSMSPSFTVEFVDVGVTLAPDRQSAVVRLTAKANVTGEQIPQVQELKIDFKKVENDWLVNHVETVRTLR